MNDNTPTIVIIEKYKWVKYALLAVVAALAILMYKGCQRGKMQVAQIDQLKKLNDSVNAITVRQDEENKRLKEDSADASRFATETQYLVEQLEDTLSKSEVRTKYLATEIKKAYQYALANKTPIDTIDIIDKCPELADAYLKEVDKRAVLKRATDSLDAARLKQLAAADRITNHFRGRYDTAMMAYNTCIMAANSLKPQVNIKIGGSFMWNTYVKGGGPMLLYEDRKGNTILTKVSFTNRGNVYEGGYAKTISLRRKR